eukprot:6645911-Pyramimonas_sp.AAC.1
MIVTAHSDVELKETGLTEPRVITKERTNVELKHTYHSEPEEDDKEFLCGEKMLQMPRGRWIQQVAMTRKGMNYSRTDNVVSVLNEELKTSNES